MVFKFMLLSVSALFFGVDHLAAAEGGFAEKARVKVLNVLSCDPNDQTCTYEVQRVLAGDQLGEVTPLVFPQRQEVGDHPLLAAGLILDLALNSSVDAAGKTVLRGQKIVKKVSGNFDGEVREVLVRVLDTAGCEGANRSKNINVCRQTVGIVGSDGIISDKLVLTSFYERNSATSVQTKQTLRVGSTYHVLVRGVGLPYGEEHQFLMAAWVESER